MLAASTALRAFVAIEQTVASADAAAEDAATRPGFPERTFDSAEWRDARAKQTAVLDQAAALRRDLADLVVDSMSAYHEVHPDAIAPVSVESNPEEAPRLLLGLEVNSIEALRYTAELALWQSRRIAHYLREAAQAVSTVLDHLDGTDSVNAQLVVALEMFVAGISGSRN